MALRGWGGGERKGGNVQKQTDPPKGSILFNFLNFKKHIKFPPMDTIYVWGRI